MHVKPCCACRQAPRWSMNAKQSERIPHMTRFLTCVLLFCTATMSAANPPVIEKVVAVSQNGAWRFDVTIRHGDTGWDDYADGWRVMDMNGNELGMRVLYHPHVDEQPFTRSLSGVVIPEGTKQVRIEARESVGGWSGANRVVPLP